MRDGNRATSKDQPGGPGGSAEIHVIKMEIKTVIESHSRAAQYVALCGQQYAVEQFACGRGRSEIMYGPKTVLTMSHGTDMIFLILAETTWPWGSECPGRLPRYAPPIADNTHDIECLQRTLDPIDKEIVIYPNIVMDKDQNLASIGRVKGIIVDHGQARTILKSDTRINSFVKGQPLQGSA
jgi:hypothetical protein